jgi:hypothetical protein
VIASIHIAVIDAHFVRYVALFAWTLGIWIAWNPLINSRQEANASAKSVHIISFIAKLLFGIYLCAALLLFEKFSIQWIAGKFHERSYAGLNIFKMFMYSLQFSLQNALRIKSLLSRR